jgi:hypothetical protein
MEWVDHVARMEERYIQMSWWGKLREREHVGDLRVEWRIILK